MNLDILIAHISWLSSTEQVDQAYCAGKSHISRIVFAFGVNFSPRSSPDVVSSVPRQFGIKTRFLTKEPTRGRKLRNQFKTNHRNVHKETELHKLLRTDENETFESLNR